MHCRQIPAALLLVVVGCAVGVCTHDLLLPHQYVAVQMLPVLYRKIHANYLGPWPIPHVWWKDHLQDRDFSLEQQFAPEVVVNTIIVKDFHNFSRRPSFPKLTKNKSGHHWRNSKISLKFAGVIFFESLLENEIFRMVAGEWGQKENRTRFRPIQVQLSRSISFNVLANHLARKANEGNASIFSAFPFCFRFFLLSRVNVLCQFSIVG